MGKSKSSSQATEEPKKVPPAFPRPGDASSQPRLRIYDKGPLKSNLNQCLECWGPHLVAQYGEGCDFIENRKYPVPTVKPRRFFVELAASYADDHFQSDDEDSKDDDATQAEGDPAAQEAIIKERRAALADTLERKSQEELSKTMAEWDRQRSKAYSWMLGMCDDKVKEFLIGDSKWDIVNRSRSPLRLLKLMLRRLSTEPTKLPADAQERALTAYSSCKQDSRALVPYYKDFKLRIQHMADVDLPVIGEETLALTFLKRLNPHYSPLLVSVMNHQRAAPKTVKEAYEMALEFYVDPRSTGDPSTTTDATSAVSLAVTLRTGRGGGGRGSARGGRGRGGGRGEPAPTKAPEGAVHPSTSEEPRGAAVTATPVKMKKCFFCHEPGHLVKECPKRAAAKEERATTLVVVSKTLQTAYTMSISTDPVAGFARYEVGHDDMSSVHIIRDRELLTNLRKAPHVVVVEGIGGEQVLDRVGDFGPFGIAWYHPGAVANVISSGRAVQDGAIKHYDSYHDEYKISMGDWTWYFGCRRDKLVYTTRMDDLAAHNLQSHFISVPAVETVQTQRKLYTQRELKGIEAAKRLMAAYAYPSIRALVKMVRHGKIRNCPVTATDLLNCLELHGPELARERGHRTRVPRRAIDLSRQDAEGLLVDADVSLHVDIMFVERVAFLVSMASPMKYLMANFVSSKSAAKLKDALWRQKGKYVKQGFNVKRILCDGESAISSLAPQLEMDVIQVDQAGPDTHVPAIEVGIQYAKRMARGIIAALAFVKILLPRMLIVWLIYFVVSRINMLPTSTLEGVVCPREYYSGRAIDARTDLACTFLERVEVHQSSTNSMRPRTRPALALMSTGNVYGTWKCLYLDSHKVGTMDAWTPLPMDDATVRHINSLSARDSAPLTTELEFKIGGRVLELPDGAPDDLADLFKAYGRNDILRSPTRAADYDPTEPLPRQAVDIDVGMRSPDPPAIPTAGESTVEADDLRVAESFT